MEGMYTASSASSPDPWPGLLLPSLFVHAHHEEPQHYRFLPEDAGRQIGGGQVDCERLREIGYPTQTGNTISAPRMRGRKVDLKMR